MLKQTLTGPWQLRQAGTETWIPATVPGAVHTDLLAAGRIPDPFIGENELQVKWVAGQDWEYRKEFDADSGLLAEEHVYLVCDGLDTLAEVSLNGQSLGQANNMFRQYRYDVKKLLDVRFGDSGRGFVHNEHARIHGQRFGNFDALAIPHCQQANLAADVHIVNVERRQQLQ